MTATATAGHRTEIEDVVPARLAITGTDVPGLRPQFRVARGDRVRAGQVLFTDRQHPAIRFVAAMAGRIESAEFGARRTLGAVVIAAEAGASAPDEATHSETETIIDPKSDLRGALLAHGLWPALRTRPFGRIPAPDDRPDAIFVTASEPDTAAPDPAAVIAGRAETLRAGLSGLADLTDGKVHLCQGPGAPLVPQDGPIHLDRRGPGPADALPGSRVRRLHSVAQGGSVWVIGYQEVLAIGELILTGRPDPRRIVALAGPRADHRRLIRTLPGAFLQPIVAGDATAGAASPLVLSGALAGGRASAWLGWFDRQITLTSTPAPHRRHRWMAAFTGQAGTEMPGPIVPMASLDRAAPRGIHALPLLRALSVGDIETAARLGCLDLVEADMALLTAACASGSDYGALLRTVLDQLHEAAP